MVLAVPAVQLLHSLTQSPTTASSSLSQVEAGSTTHTTSSRTCRRCERCADTVQLAHLHPASQAEVASWWRKARRTTAAHLQEVLVLVLMLVVQVLQMVLVLVVQIV